MKPPSNYLGQLIRFAREQRYMTGEELARRIKGEMANTHCRQAACSNWERGERIPRLSVIKKMVEVLVIAEGPLLEARKRDLEVRKRLRRKEWDYGCEEGEPGGDGGGEGTDGGGGEAGGGSGVGPAGEDEGSGSSLSEREERANRLAADAGDESQG